MVYVRVRSICKRITQHAHTHARTHAHIHARTHTNTNSSCECFATVQPPYLQHTGYRVQGTSYNMHGITHLSNYYLVKVREAVLKLVEQLALVGEGGRGAHVVQSRQS